MKTLQKECVLKSMNIEQNIMLPYIFLLNSGLIVLKNLVVANWEIPNHESIGKVLFIVGSVLKKNNQFPIDPWRFKHD